MTKKQRRFVIREKKLGVGKPNASLIVTATNIHKPRIKQPKLPLVAKIIVKEEEEFPLRS